MNEYIDRAEVLRKVRELFAASSYKSSPEEAASAARTVRKLMDDNDISLAELEEIRPCCLNKDS